MNRDVNDDLRDGHSVHHGDSTVIDIAEHLRAVDQPSGGGSTGRPSIVVNGVQDRQLLADASDALMRDPSLYLSGNAACVVEADDSGRSFVRLLNRPLMRVLLARNASWHRNNGTYLTNCPVPVGIADMLMASPPRLRRLARVVSYPIFLSNGSLTRKPSYYETDGVLYAPTQEYSLPPENPPVDRVAGATGLLAELLIDFPFVSDADRTMAVCAILQPFVRSAIDGPTPLYAIDANTSGTGKSLIAETITTVCFGQPAAGTDLPGSEDGIRKGLTAKLIAQPDAIIFDNVIRRVKSSSLFTALTETYWEDRILGVSQTCRVPIRCLWLLTGNNVETSDEGARRMVWIRIQAQVERPELRDSFKHDPLMPWVRRNRQHLVSAALTIIQSWFAQGCPAGGSQRLGRYDEWSRVMGGILSVAGFEGFLGNQERQRDRADDETRSWAEFFGAWWEDVERGRENARKARELVCLADAHIPEVLGDGGVRSQETRLGQALKRRVDRVVGGFRIRQVRGRHRYYEIERASAGPGGKRD